MPDPAFKGKVVKKKVGGGGTQERKKLPFDSDLVAASLHFCLQIIYVSFMEMEKLKLLQAEPNFIPQFESKFKRCASATSEVI